MLTFNAAWVIPGCRGAIREDLVTRFDSSSYCTFVAFVLPSTPKSQLFDPAPSASQKLTVRLKQMHHRYAYLRVYGYHSGEQLQCQSLLSTAMNKNRPGPSFTAFARRIAEVATRA